MIIAFSSYNFNLFFSREFIIYIYIMLQKYTIFGERCSGTNYLENIINMNFDVNITWKYGFKHFFGHNDLSNSDDTLFICIVINLPYWINSFYTTPHHWPKYKKMLCNEKRLDEFLNKEFLQCIG